LRLRVANSMMSGRKETIQSLRGLLVREGELEVAGYRLNINLVSTLDEKKITVENFYTTIDWHWFEVLAAENQPVAMASNQIIQTLGAQGVDINVHKVVGESFWANQEIAEISELVSKTADVLVA